jgi:hypothetical protein
MDAFSMPVVISVVFFGTVAYGVWANLNAKTRRAEIHAEVQTRLIEKFANAPEFVQFLNSEAGRQFVAGVDKMPSLMARDRIVSGFSRGIITSLLGIGFLCIWAADSNIGFMYPGFILLGLGVGFFLATVVSLKLSRVYGLIVDDRKPVESQL